MFDLRKPATRWFVQWRRVYPTRQIWNGIEVKWSWVTDIGKVMNRGRLLFVKYVRFFRGPLFTKAFYWWERNGTVLTNISICSDHLPARWHQYFDTIFSDLQILYIVSVQATSAYTYKCSISAYYFIYARGLAGAGWG